MAERYTDEELERYREGLANSPAPAPRLLATVDALKNELAEKHDAHVRAADAFVDAMKRAEVAEAERDRLREALYTKCWELANYTFRGKDASLGEEADEHFRAALEEKS